MKLYTSPITSVRFAILAVLLLATTIPLMTSASSTKPLCELTVKTNEGTVVVTKSEDILLVKGEEIQITWESRNAKSAGSSHEIKTPLRGTATDTPSTTTTYSYKFTAGSKKVVCEVTAHVVTGDITDATLISEKSRPTLKGNAFGTKNVQVSIYKEGSTKVLYRSNVIRVKNGIWKLKIPKKLADGIYEVVLSGEKTFELNTITREVLTIGKIASVVEKPKTTIVVVQIPLLLGGTARGGTSASVSYLQVVNLGKEQAVIKGFVMKQNGSASTDVIAGLTVVDDTETARGSIEGAEGKSPFKDGSATVPIDVTLALGQMRLFTIKAILANDVAKHVGAQLKIDVIGVITTASIRNSFPVRGTTWTLGM